MSPALTHSSLAFDMPGVHEFSSYPQFIHILYKGWGCLQRESTSHFRPLTRLSWMDIYLKHYHPPCLLIKQGLLPSQLHRSQQARRAEAATQGSNQAGWEREPVLKCWIWFGKCLSAFQVSTTVQEHLLQHLHRYR